MSATPPKSTPSDGAVKPSPPVNLRELWGSRYKVEWDETYVAEHGKKHNVDDRWLQRVVCRAGEIFAHGGSLLAAATNTCGPIANKLKALPFCKVWQDGSDGVTVLFHVDHFPQIAKILHAKTRRHLSDAQRRGLEKGRQHQFKKKRGRDTEVAA